MTQTCAYSGDAVDVSDDLWDRLAVGAHDGDEAMSHCSYSEECGLTKHVNAGD